METPVNIVLGSISLEGRLAVPADAILGGVVVCHPHPLYGGEMDNPVVIRASEVCQAAGLATLRFNFRGAGRSGGVHANGEGEQEDVASALEFLEGQLGSHFFFGKLYPLGEAVAGWARNWLGSAPMPGDVAGDGSSR